jgi:hypothetical protein
MPIHDWTRVRANRFHHFHQTWTANLAAALNSGRLPPGFFALAERITCGPEADVVALELTPPAGTASSPLEATYETTWTVFPAVLKAPLERPGPAPETT